MLKYRIITAVILIPIVLALLFYLPAPYFCLLAGVIFLGGAWEWSNLMQLTSLFHRYIYLAIVALIFVSVTFVSIPLLLLVGFLWWLLALVLVVIYPRASACWSKGLIWRGLMGLFVLVPSWAALCYIRSQNDGIFAILFLFILIWGADSAAYFVGRKWGNKKLAPLVSPGKSIEGVMGALVFTTILALVTLWIGKVSFNVWPWAVLLSLTTAVFSIVGDLTESMLKRQAGLKDSGKLLPGHGGLLDRIDSLTAAAPVFAFGALLLGVYL